MTKSESKRLGTVQKMVGQTFGALTVLERADDSKHKKDRWLCRCECGKTCVRLGPSLRDKKSFHCGCKFKLDAGQAAFNRTITQYRDHARMRGFEFCLSEDEAFTLFKSDCNYCGAPPSNKMQPRKANGAFVYNGIDRLDSTKDYTVDNCVPACRICNHAKKNYPLEVWYDWIARLVKHQTETMKEAA